MKKIRQTFTYTEKSDIQFSEDEEEILHLFEERLSEEYNRYLPDLTDAGNCFNLFKMDQASK